MTEIEEQVEAIYQDADLTREEKIAAIARLYGITGPISAPDLFAHIRSWQYPSVEWTARVREATTRTINRLL